LPHIFQIQRTNYIISILRGNSFNSEPYEGPGILKQQLLSISCEGFDVSVTFPRSFIKTDTQV